MTVPKNKIELLGASEFEFQELLEYIDQIPAEKLDITFPSHMLNRNIRDVLGHLHHWHLLMLRWYDQGMKGEQPAMPSEGYNWKDLPLLNRSIRDRCADISLAAIKKELIDSHVKVHALIERHSHKELFTKKYYAWTGSTSLAVYLRAATSSHYKWAYKLINQALSTTDR